MIETLFPIVLGEVVLGGGGRTFSVGPISLRMILFAASLLATMFGMMTASRQRDGLVTANLLVLGFFISLIPGLLIDAAHGTPATIIIQEIQPLLFWLSAPFFAFALQDVRSVEKSATIIVYGGTIVAVITSLLMFGLFIGFVSFRSLYLWSDRTEELFFRGFTNFFYKGHFFIAVALIFCVVLTPRWWKTMSLVLVTSIILSLTRGLFLAVAVAIILSFFSERRQGAILLIALGTVVIFSLYSQAITGIIFDPSRARSAQTRSQDLSYFLSIFDYNTLLFGDGVGVLLNGRSNIENSFLWVIWRFGIVGLTFMFTPLFICLRYYYQIPRNSSERRLASAFFFGVIMLYVVTAFNPFINNSIGLTYLLCALFALRRLRQAALTTSAPFSPAGLTA